MRPALVRFLLATSGHGWGVAVGFTFIAVLGVWLLMIGGGEDVKTALASVVFLQMFAVATGFNAAASRGYYDPFLAASVSRRRLALSHWATSAMPGFACWFAIGLMEWLVYPTAVPTACRPGPLLALTIVSTVSWAISLPLPRFTGGVLWMAAIVGLFASRVGLLRLREATVIGSASGLREVLVSVFFTSLFPFALLDDWPVVKKPAVLFTLAGLSLLAVLAGAVYIVRRDYSLADPT